VESHGYGKASQGNELFDTISSGENAESSKFESSSYLVPNWICEWNDVTNTVPTYCHEAKHWCGGSILDWVGGCFYCRWAMDFPSIEGHRTKKVVLQDKTM
jgi:hypothetical protein